MDQTSTDTNTKSPTDNSMLKPMALMSCMGIFVIALSFLAGITGSYLGYAIQDQNPDSQASTSTGSGGGLVDTEVSVNEDSAIIDVVDQNADSVVSIVITQELTDVQQRLRDRLGVGGSSLQNLGEGSGFIISADGLILTNRHVVEAEDANYSILFNDGSELEAEVLTRDTFLDIAVLQVNPGDKELKPVTLGNSAGLKVGQRVVAIGNSLGEFSGTVSYGIVSGLGRSIIASDSSGSSEQIDNVIQTDASINPGNSGGPLFDILGNVVGVNVAVARDAENIGFAIPIDEVRKVIDDVIEFGEIRRPYLGVRYLSVDASIQEELELTQDFGAIIVGGDNGEDAVLEDSPAAKAGLQEGDHILSVNGEEITIDNTLVSIIQRYNVGDTVELEVVREGRGSTVQLTLEQANF